MTRQAFDTPPLKRLADEARRASDMDLAAGIRRVLAETLENPDHAGTADRSGIEKPRPPCRP